MPPETRNVLGRMYLRLLDVAARAEDTDAPLSKSEASEKEGRQRVADATCNLP